MMMIMMIRNPYQCPEYFKLEDFSFLISDTSRITKIIENMEKKEKKGRNLTQLPCCA